MHRLWALRSYVPHQVHTNSRPEEKRVVGQGTVLCPTCPTQRGNVVDKRKLINRCDIFGIAIILIICVCALFVLNRANDTEIQAEIKVRDSVVQMIALDEDKIFVLDEHPAIEFIVRDGRIAFYKSDCPDQICVRNGFLHLAGQISVCLPNHVALVIVSSIDDYSDVDVFLN